MLHNTGSYGPNDAPVNRSASVNLPQINSHLNMAQNGNNLSKMPHQSIQPPNGHYGLPEYNPYGHTPLNMSSHLGHLPNYQPISFSHHYMTPNPTSMSSMSWQNGMLPMNLNMQHDQSANMMSYHNSYEKRYSDTSLNDYKEPNLRKVPLNIPQIHPKIPIRHPDFDSFTGHNDSSRYDHNLDLGTKPPERPQLDSARRQNIENTVRLIENILINTTNKSKSLQTSEWNSVSKDKTQSVSENLNANDKVSDENLRQQNIEISESQTLMTSRTTTNSKKDKNEPSDNSTLADPENLSNTALSPESKEDPDDSSQGNSNDDLGDEDYMELDDEISNEGDDEKQNETDDEKHRDTDDDKQNDTDDEKQNEVDDEKQNETDDEKQDEMDDEKESNSDENSTKSTSNNQIFTATETLVVIVKNEIDEDMVESKIEINIDPNYIDMDYYQPFLRDSNGVQRDEVDCKIVDSEVSIEEAAAAMKKVPDTACCYECPHCTLLFKHPKRFLIHTKWHSFGLTYEKRTELAKMREQRKTERREARALERIQSNDVTDKPVAGRVFRCSDCDKLFSSKGSLKNHRKREHATRSRDCRICGATVLGWNALRAHIATHTSKAPDADGFPWKCTDCPKKFKFSHSLAKHRDTHKEKTHGCDECPKMFGSQYLLKLHRKTHERAQRGTTCRCTYCGKGFYECYSLQVHERTHRNERPYLCDICNATFGTNSSLKRHMKVSHNSAKPHECTVCHRSFSTESIRDKHQQRVHANPEDFKYPCAECDCKYLKMKDLQKHIYKVHPKNKRRKRARTYSDSE